MLHLMIFFDADIFAEAFRCLSRLPFLLPLLLSSFSAIHYFFAIRCFSVDFRFAARLSMLSFPRFLFFSR